MAAEYRFLDRWIVPHEIERVFAAVGEPLAYPEWWSDVFLAATGDGGPPQPGNRTSVVARGFLPYPAAVHARVCRGRAADAPVLRPLFRANHNWTMRRGQQRILERLLLSPLSSE